MAAYASLASLSFLIEQIQPSTLPHESLIISLKDKMAFLQEFLERYTQTSSQEIQDLETRIRDVCYEVEDVIESHVLDQSLKPWYKRRNSSKHLSRYVNRILGEFEAIKDKAMDIAADGRVNDDHQQLWRRIRPSRREDPDMVGFDKHLIRIMDQITSQGSSTLQILPVVGMGGIGKTTLVRNVYDHKFVKEHFQIRLWSTISQSYNVQDILLCFLRDLGVVYPIQLGQSSNNELGDKVYQTLTGRRYLIVLDDVWSTHEVWDPIRRFLPNNGNGSRVIVTTRLLSVASYIGSYDPYEMEFLDEEQSLNLLNLKVFGHDTCPSVLEDIRRKIALSCRGLPLAIVVVGGLLAKSDMSRGYWEYIAREINSVINSNDYCLEILSLSYTNLPVHLKPCFLYMGVFPEDFEVRVSKLVKLWVAEGFLKTTRTKCLEDNAVGYLTDLVERNLILVGKHGYSGKIKSCRIHDLLRDLCVREARKQNFMCVKRSHIVHFPQNREIKPCRSIYRYYVQDERYNLSILSPLRFASLSLSSLELLRNLDVADVNSPQKNLLLLSSRYLNLSVDLFTDVSTSSAFALISILSDLQTIILSEMPSRSKPVVLPSQIWKMLQLRHIEIQRVILPDPPDDNDDHQQHSVLENLQTLLNVHNFKISKKVIRRTPNIKKLKVTYTEDSKGAEWTIYRLDNLAGLCNLESFSCSMHEKLTTWHISFPRSLTKLTLAGGQNPWEDMTMIGQLPNLEVLRLQNDAFYGKTWRPVEDEFVRLKSLHLDNVYLEQWEADNTHFPRLESLNLCEVWRMKEIPSSIGDIATLRLISLELCSICVVNSARLLQEDQESMGNTDIRLHVSLQDHITVDLQMAEAEVGFLLDNLSRLVQEDHGNLIASVRNLIGNMEEDLHFLKDFLRDSIQRRSKDERLSDLAKQIRKVVYEAEDIIDTFVTWAAQVMNTINYFETLYRRPTDLMRIAREIKSITLGIRDVYAVSSKVNFTVTNIVDEVPGEVNEAMRYDQLPYHLRKCFLYLGMFPENLEIPARKLTRLWIAEGFIQQKDNISLEDRAEHYLNDLISMGFIQVEKRRRDGKVKTCRLHPNVADFFKTQVESERENFLQEMTMTSEGFFDPPVADIHRFTGLCIHSNLMEFIHSRPYGPRVRSFVSFSEEVIDLPEEYTAAIPVAFKLVRVLEANPINFSTIPSQMYQLIHLRYVAISVHLGVLPKQFAKLWNIETLIVHTTQRALEIKADIWKMKHLRHVETNVTTMLPKPGRNSLEGENIHTLGTISPQSCSKPVLERARCMKKLVIGGRLAILKKASFESFDKLGNLEKLKLLNDASEGPLPSLPSRHQFPPKLKSLTLADTFLNWTYMTVLGQLESLEVLKLKKAFMGRTWETIDDGAFRKLQMLYINGTDLVIWKASKDHFPCLKSVELRNCEQLQQVPIELAEIPSFQILEVYNSKSAGTSAKEIQKIKEEMQDAESTSFKLSIVPPES